MPDDDEHFLYAVLVVRKRPDFEISTGTIDHEMIGTIPVYDNEEAANRIAAELGGTVLTLRPVR